MFGFNDEEDENPKTPDFSKISNPEVRKYMEDKYQKEQALVQAKDKRDLGAYGEIAGKFLEGINQPTNIRFENSFKNLGSTPKRSVGESFKYDDGGAKELIERGVKDAEGNLAKTKQDFNDRVQMENYSRQEADYGDENDPTSEQSKQYQMLAKKFVPAGNYDGLSAAKIKKLIPPLQAAYEIDAKKRANVQQGSWSSTGQTDSEGYLILMDKNGNTKKGPKVAQKPGTNNKALTEANAALAGGNRKSTKLDEIEGLYANTKWNGPVSGRLGELASAIGFSVNDDFDTLNQNTKSLISSYIKEMSGTAASEKEMQRLEAVMPRPADTDAAAKNKIKALKKEAQAIVNERREAAGLPPIGSAQDQVQQFQQNNGQTQMPVAPKPSWAK